MTVNPDQRILIVIPAYNAARHLNELVERIIRSVPKLDILIVNDGSTDDTAEILATLPVRHLSLVQNSGKGAALLAGFDYARRNNYTAVLTLDADLQHAPEEIPRLLRKYSTQVIVIGARKVTQSSMPLQRKLSNSVTSLIISIFSGQCVRDSQSGFRLFPISLLDNLDLKCSDYDLESELLFKSGAAGIEIVEVAVSTIYRQANSHISPVPDILRFIRQIWNRLWM